MRIGFLIVLLLLTQQLFALSLEDLDGTWMLLAIKCADKPDTFDYYPPFRTFTIKAAGRFQHETLFRTGEARSQGEMSGNLVGDRLQIRFSDTLSSPYQGISDFLVRFFRQDPPITLRLDDGHLILGGDPTTVLEGCSAGVEYVYYFQQH